MHHARMRRRSRRRSWVEARVGSAIVRSRAYMRFFRDLAVTIAVSSVVLLTAPPAHAGEEESRTLFAEGRSLREQGKSVDESLLALAWIVDGYRRERREQAKDAVEGPHVHVSPITGMESRYGSRP